MWCALSELVLDLVFRGSDQGLAAGIRDHYGIGDRAALLSESHLTFLFLYLYYFLRDRRDRGDQYFYLHIKKERKECPALRDAHIQRPGIFGP